MNKYLPSLNWPAGSTKGGPGRQRRLSLFLWMRDCALKEFQKRGELSFAPSYLLATTALLPLATEAANLTVDTDTDVTDGDTSSIAALQGNPGGDGFISLREAIVAANNTAGADEITFDFGASPENIRISLTQGGLPIASDLSITGPEREDISDFILSGQNQQHIFDIQSGQVTLADIWMTSGMTTGDGGLISNNSGALTLQGCYLVNGEAGRGGGIFNTSGSLELTNCNIQLNEATTGAGIYSLAGSVQISDSRFTRNDSDIGGSIFIKEGTLAVSDCDFLFCTSTKGGGIYNEAGTGTVTDTIFRRSRGEGAGIFQAGGSLDISDCSFSNQSNYFSREGFGGAIFHADGGLNITDSLFELNSSIKGGAIFSQASPAISGCTFRSNDANSGGALYHTGGILTLMNSTFDRNLAQLDGGGVFSKTNLTDQASQLTNCTFSQNSAVGRGGAFFNEEGLSELTHCTLTDNLAASGGGIASVSDANTETKVTSSLVRDNHGDDLTLLSGDGTRSLISQGGNLVGTGNATGDFDQTLDRVDPDLALGLTNLNENTGALCRLPLPGSPLLDAAVASSPAVTTDQRGLTRDSLPDIGAAELTADTNLLLVDTIADLTDGDTSSLSALQANPGADGAISLREAVLASNETAEGIAVAFDPSLSGALVLTQGELPVIASQLTVNGPLDGSLSVSANDASRIFHVEQESDLGLANLVLSNGTTTECGGGILAVDSRLTLTDVSLSDCFAGDHGGGVCSTTSQSRDTPYNELWAQGLAVSNCEASNRGGGLYNLVGATEVEDSSFTNNRATTGGGIANYSDHEFSMDFVVRNSEFVGNAATLGGGFHNLAERLGCVRKGKFRAIV